MPTPELSSILGADHQADTLRGHRVQLDISIAELSRRLHLSPALVSRWENGHRRPAPEHIPRIAAVFNISVSAAQRLFVDHPPGRFDGVRLPGLHRLRADAGLTQTQLAASLGIAASTAAAWEKGETAIPAHRLAKIAAFLGAEPGDLLRRASHALPTAPTSHNGLRGLRLRAGMTQAEAARVLGTTVPTLARYERGERPTPVALIHRISAVYAVPLRAVFQAAGHPPPRLPQAAGWARIPVAVRLQLLRKFRG